MKAEKSKIRDSYWWCPECKEELLGCRVTYQECCDTCGHRVVWVENRDMEELHRLAAKGLRAEQAEKWIELQLQHNAKVSGPYLRGLKETLDRLKGVE